MPVELTTLDDCALLRLNRPETLNALSFRVLKEISDALTEVATWKVRALIVTGAGDKAFCAGADIKELGGRPLIECKRGAEVGRRPSRSSTGCRSLPSPPSTASRLAAVWNWRWPARSGSGHRT